MAVVDDGELASLSRSTLFLYAVGKKPRMARTQFPVGGGRNMHAQRVGGLLHGNGKLLSSGVLPGKFG